MAAKFELKDDIQPVFKKKRNVPFVPSTQINEELDRFERTGVLSKIDCSHWALPTVYVKKKSKEIPVFADFSTELNAALKDYHYPLPSPEENFVKLKGGIFFKSTSLTRIFKYRKRKNVLSCSVSTPIVGCTNSEVFRSGSRLRWQSSNK